MRLAVIGSTGGVGQHVIRHALSEANVTHVYALARSKEKVATVFGEDFAAKNKEKLTFIYGTSVLDDSESSPLKALLENLDSESDQVISCLGNVRGSEEGMVIERGTKAIISAMEKYSGSVRKLQILTSIGCGDSYYQMPKLSWIFAYFVKPVILRKIYADLEAAEQIAFDSNTKTETSGVKVTIIRPPGLSDEAGKNRYVLTHGEDLEAAENMGTAMWPRADIGLAMVKIATDVELTKTWGGKAVSVLGKKEELGKL
eukprot:TRINITY_DN8904_c0_g2_i1.p1 TRINITY_DN8904_c0_g2~~TRINITY_DN8904_c0_g2_i1.p1  ORF type:complete len:258 (+),score=50.74 TRINITY_DN8904_c0_g2_i1:54-827(+)